MLKDINLEKKKFVIKTKKIPLIQFNYKNTNYFIVNF